jgi:8-oxo-dGTP pyrophosphatase MutT (NUDIX family)
MIRRKDSFGYIDFLRGKYSPYNINQIQGMINEMSSDEKIKISTEPFDLLWMQMWGDASKSQYKSEEYASMKKFDLIRFGVIVNDEQVTLTDLISQSATSWCETEWEFPKGRRDPKEKDLDCALREFEEETGISQNKITIVENVLPFEEIFIGSNHKSYKHKYYLMQIDDIEKCETRDFDTSEVSKLEWKTYEMALECIRPYNLEKKRLINDVFMTLTNYIRT